MEREMNPPGILPPPTSAQIRQELHDLILRDLLGPAGGENEIVAEATVRDRAEQWGVILFLINAQPEPKQLKDKAWLFQVELPPGRPRPLAHLPLPAAAPRR